MDAPALAQDFRRDVDALRQRLSQAILGQPEAVDCAVYAAIAGGHVLLEGLPGLGKTELVKALSRAIACRPARVQFTPDLLPSDILGTTVIAENDRGERIFRFQKGPIFAPILLADEINRASPKTQAALLEAMQEGCVTAGDQRLELPQPFLVLATQNPIELEGTFPLPEAQLDRFLFKVAMRPLDEDHLFRVIQLTELETKSGEASAPPLFPAERLVSLRAFARLVPVPESVARLAARLIEATRPETSKIPEIRRFLRFGASPRGAQALVRAARIHALLEGRPNASASDVAAMAKPALRHRLLLNFDGQAERVLVDDLIDALLRQILKG